MAAVGILMAVCARARSGKGQYVDVSMLDTMGSWMQTAAGFAFSQGRSPAFGEHMHGARQPWYRLYQTRDNGYMAVGAAEEKAWVQLCAVLGRPDLAGRHMCKGQERDRLGQELETLFLQRTRDEWTSDFMRAEDACCTPVLDIAEVLKHPQTVERGMVLERSAETGDPIAQLGFPIKLSDTPAELRQRAPALGEHTAMILDELGYTAEEQDLLRRAGAVRETSVGAKAGS